MDGVAGSHRGLLRGAGGRVAAIGSLGSWGVIELELITIGDESIKEMLILFGPWHGVPIGSGWVGGPTS